MSEYENENYDYDYSAGYADPAQVDVSEMDPTQLANVIQQSSALGAQRALGEMAQAQIQSQQFDLIQKGHQTWLEAEKSLEAYDPQWPQRRELAYQTLQQHPSFATQEALHDPELAAEQLWRAAEYGRAEREQQQSRVKEVDDSVFADRLLAAHRQSYSAFRQATDAGKSIHDLLDDDR